MLVALWAVGVAFGNPWEGRVADVSSTRGIPAPADAVYAQLVDFEALQQVFPADCATEWAVGPEHAGVGARAVVTYRMASLKRRLTATLSKAEPDRVVDLDHEGKKGFVTRFELAPAANGTRVTLTTFLNQPPWPFRGVFFNRVRPAWIDCWDRALIALEERSAP